MLVKIITLIDGSSDEEKMHLIDEISNATNQQTPVINADRFANESFHKSIQQKVFDRYGLLFERKRGEFSDGVRSNYVNERSIIERNQFFRVFYSANGYINLGAQKKLFQKNKFPHFSLSDDDAFDRFYIGFHVFRKILKDRNQNIRFSKDTYAKVYAYIQLFPESSVNIEPDITEKNFDILESKWTEFIVYAKNNIKSGQRKYIDKVTGEEKITFNESRFYRSGGFEKDVIDYFHTKA